MKWSKIGSLLILTAVVYPTISTDAQVLFQEDFQDGNAASRWTMSQAGGDSTVDFAFDYSTAGIPMAPNGTGTIGLKMQANLGRIEWHRSLSGRPIVSYDSRILYASL